MMEQCKEKLSIAMFTGQNQLRSDGLWGSWIRQHKKTLSRVSGKRKKKYHLRIADVYIDIAKRMRSI